MNDFDPAIHPRAAGKRAALVLSLILSAAATVIACGDDDGSDPDPDAGDDGMAGQSDDDAGRADAAIDEDGGIAGPAPVTFDSAEAAMYETLSPLPDLPADPTNAFADNAAAAELGQQLFFDKRYSGALREASDLGAVGETGKIACFTCHSGPYLDDQRSQPRTVSLGAGFHARNAPTAINAAFYRWTNWGGRFSAPWELPPAVLESAVIMNSSRLQLAHFVFDEYRTEYEAVFGAMEPAIGSDAARFPATGKPKPVTMPATDDGPWEMMSDADRVIVNRIVVNFGKAIEAYTRRLVSRNAPFDRFVAGEEHAISEDAKRGLKVFLGAGRCVNCHLGPHFSDGLFHNLGVPQDGERVPVTDNGRLQDIPPLLRSPLNSASATYSDDPNTGRLAGLTDPPPEDTRGQFRTPSLRGVALTAPYMHSGQLATLEDVVDFYDVGGEVDAVNPAAGVRSPLIAPLYLSAQEKADLIAFLHTLTGEAVPAALLDDTSTQ